MKKLVHKFNNVNRGIDRSLNSYDKLREWRKQQMITVSTSHHRLNNFHDELVTRAVRIAIEKIKGEWGDPPAPFAFFLMGSAGRFEQSIWSDQDHGIIFDGSSACEPYFLQLGLEITNALAHVDYELCDGKVMASNPLWCKSTVSWREQLIDWLDEASWQSLRHFSTFFDSRVLIGDKQLLHGLKDLGLRGLQQRPHLYTRLVENVGFIKKGIGAFGQFLPEQRGKQAGTIHLKQTVLFPYVNAMRLMAFKQNIFSSSTISRFKLLPEQYKTLKSYEGDFVELLNFRLHVRSSAKNYSEVHLLPIAELTKEEKQELKLFMKKGYKLFSETKTLIQKECSSW